ncbi:MAG: hypothetical protein J6W84_08555 [Bacteroidales bacterium]|nr:hypothetical protein [Bacteroidales bacterium]
MKTTIKFLGLALLVVMTLTGCKKQYTITVQSNNNAWGTVTGGGTYYDGDQATLSAIPAAGYYFISWQDGDKSNPRTITVSTNAVYIATFSDDPNGGGNNPGGGGGNGGDAQVMSGTISENVTWPDRGLAVDYIIEGVLYVDGNALLTIDPGVTVMFTGIDGSISIGSNAGIRMVGTAEKPIVFQGPTNNPNNGSWGGIVVGSNRNDNQFEYVKFLRGGSATQDYEGVIDLYGKLSMKHCTIDGGNANGIYVNDEATITAFDDNTIKNCAKNPVRSYELESYKNFTYSNTFTANGKNYLCVERSYIDDDMGDITIPKLSVPYFFNEGMTFGGSRTITIAPGTEIVMANNTGASVASEVVFKAIGTASEPIIFRGLGNSPSWYGIGVYTEQSASTISYCKFENAGNGNEWDNRQCMWIGYYAHFTLTNNTFGPSGHYGVAIEDVSQWGNVTHSGNTFTNCASGNVLIYSPGEYGGVEYTEEQVLNDLPAILRHRP